LLATAKAMFSKYPDPDAARQLDDAPPPSGPLVQIKMPEAGSQQG